MTSAFILMVISNSCSLKKLCYIHYLNFISFYIRLTIKSNIIQQQHINFYFGKYSLIIRQHQRKFEKRRNNHIYRLMLINLMQHKHIDWVFLPSHDQQHSTTRKIKRASKELFFQHKKVFNCCFNWRK